MLTNDFYLYYTSHLRKSYRFMNSLLKIVLTITVLLMIVSYQFIENRIHDNQALIDKLSFNQLYVSDDDIYLDTSFNYNHRDILKDI